MREGDEIVVTDRGRAVARIVPVEGERMFDRLIREGLITPAPGKGPRAVPEPIPGAGPLSDLVIESRR